MEKFCLGCKITIYEHTRERGDHFVCHGYESYDKWCYHHSLGYVGNDETSSITCTCPVDFESIEYDIPPQDWALELNKATGKF